ncbi:hypothetical protein PV326_005647 [Microctonus aethiopoides]|nr:hypothetical protein PV326_005647 [Microctonus aethiopoides]
MKEFLLQPFPQREDLAVRCKNEELGENHRMDEARFICLQDPPQVCTVASPPTVAGSPGQRRAVARNGGSPRAPVRFTPYKERRKQIKKLVATSHLCAVDNN